MLALYGQGRYDQSRPAISGSSRRSAGCCSGGDPRARATEDDVRAFFSRYDPWAGLAGLHFLLA